MRTTFFYFIAFLFLCSCGVKKTDSGSTSQNVTQSELMNPALPGDNPDPSIIRVGDTYFATSTTNEWAPYFTIYKSTDLKNWKLVNHVFPEGFKDMKDQWGENNFWASELAYDSKQKRIYAYYTAHNRAVKGNPGLQCGVAWIDADKIETGKFTDNGPVIIEDDCGAIDAFEFQDKGKIYAFWKNDGNGCGKESWIWMQEINESRTQLLGTKRKVYTNSQPWETALVEGACFFRMGEYIYSMYAVGGCCDAQCNYKTGIARTKDLASGVWEKYSKNPIMSSNEKWRCPGHGTVVESKEGNFYMIYHAFNKNYDVFVGREGLIEKLTVAEDGWPVLHNETTANRPKAELDFEDNFTKDKSLKLEWQWPSKFEKPSHSFNKGLNLEASATNHGLGSFFGQYIKTVDFTVNSTVSVTKADAGICLGGSIFKSKWPGELGALGISVSTNGYKVFNTFDGTYEILKQADGVVKGEVELKMNVSDNCKLIDLFYRVPGREWIKLYSHVFNPAKYAPWGMGYRIGIVAKGDQTNQAVFKNFLLKNN
ncbi:MAG: beta-xylosidase [Pedobacter sp.]|nr:MAG: beta-xylosidase [Pedobacter sp.]